MQYSSGYWDVYYKNKNVSKESSFANFVIKYIEENTNEDFKNLIEFGCGIGNDMFYLSRKFEKAIGIDGAEQAIIKANQIRDYLKFENILFEERDLGQPIKLDCFLDGNTVYYCRFLFHAIPEYIEDNILDYIISTSKEGDLLALEFRTLEDKWLHKVYDNHYRRYIDEKIIIEKVMKHNGFKDLLYRYKSRGLSVYKEEDPFLCRLIFRK